MIENMRSELSELSTKIERKKKIEAMLQSLEQKKQELSQREVSLKAALSKEQADVDRLERTSASSVLYSLLGKKDEKLGKERQEACAAKLKYDAALSELDDCKARIEELLGEKATLNGCDEQYNKVFAKLKMLLQSDPAYADKLCSLERKRGEVLSQLKELDEAIAAGNAALEQIDAISDSLDSAEGWGTWDVLGGGLIADIEKHSRLDEAQSGAEQLQILLSRFHTELADVQIDSQMSALNIDGFLRFADYFFDGLVADWSVLTRIQDSQQSVNQVSCQVSSALSKLSSLKTARTSEKASVEKQIADLVTSV